MGGDEFGVHKMKIPNNIHVGMIVNYHAIIGGPVTSSGHKITSIERRHKRWIVFVTGVSGFICVEALSANDKAS